MFSTIIVADKLFHIPMMDFSTTWSAVPYGPDRVKEIMEKLGQREGVILNSGRSFHYYGTKPLHVREWTSMMNQASNYSEIGPNYPRRRLQQGGGALRIVSHDSKPKIPEVIDYLKI